MITKELALEKLNWLKTSGKHKLLSGNLEALTALDEVSEYVRGESSEAAPESQREEQQSHEEV